MICDTCNREVWVELTEFDSVSDVFDQAAEKENWNTIHSLGATVMLRCSCGYVEAEFSDGKISFVADLPDGWIYESLASPVASGED